MHVVIIYINVDNFLAFFQTLVLVFEAQFLGELLFKPIPFVVLIEFGALAVVDGSLMSLVVLGLVSSDMWIHVECFLMISIDDASDGIFGIGSSVGFQSCLIKVILIFGIGQRAGVRFEFLNILLDFFSTFFLALSLFFKFLLTNSFPDCDILLVTTCALWGRIS